MVKTAFKDFLSFLLIRYPAFLNIGISYIYENVITLFQSAVWENLISCVNIIRKRVYVGLAVFTKLKCDLSSTIPILRLFLRFEAIFMVKTAFKDVLGFLLIR